MTRPLRRAAAAVMVCGLLVVGSAVAANAFWSQVFRGSISVEGDSRVRVVAAALQTPLAPGRVSPLSVQLKNPSSAPVELADRVTLELPRDAGGPVDCPLSALVVELLGPRPASVPARSSARVRFGVRLADGAPASCQGASVPVRIVLRSRTP